MTHKACCESLFDLFSFFKFIYYLKKKYLYIYLFSFNGVSGVITTDFVCQLTVFYVVFQFSMCFSPRLMLQIKFVKFRCTSESWDWCKEASIGLKTKKGRLLHFLLVCQHTLPKYFFFHRDNHWTVNFLLVKSTPNVCVTHKQKEKYICTFKCTTQQKPLPTCPQPSFPNLTPGPGRFLSVRITRSLTLAISRSLPHFQTFAVRNPIRWAAKDPLRSRPAGSRSQLCS